MTHVSLIRRVGRQDSLERRPWCQHQWGHQSHCSIGSRCGWEQYPSESGRNCPSSGSNHEGHASQSSKVINMLKQMKDYTLEDLCDGVMEREGNSQGRSYEACGNKKKLDTDAPRPIIGSSWFSRRCLERDQAFGYGQTSVADSLCDCISARPPHRTRTLSIQKAVGTCRLSVECVPGKENPSRLGTKFRRSQHYLTPLWLCVDDGTTKTWDPHMLWNARPQQHERWNSDSSTWRANSPSQCHTSWCAARCRISLA